MRKTIHLINCLFTVLCCTTMASMVGAEVNYESPVALAIGQDSSTVFLVTAGSNRVMAVDSTHGTQRFSTPLPGKPNDITVSPDGQTLYVTIDGPNGCIVTLDAASGKILAQRTASHTPCAPTVSPEGKRLYVCERFHQRIAIYDEGGRRETIPVEREPIATALTRDGATLLVGNHLPSGRADGDYAGAGLSILDTASQTVAHTIRLPNGSTAVRDVCLAPDDRTAYVTHILARHQVPATQIARGWVNTNALSIIDVPTRTRTATILLDDLDLGAANPWGVVVSPEGKYLCVAHAGTHELSIIDRQALHQKVAELSQADRDRLENRLGFLSEIRQRVALTDKGPRQLVFLKDKVFAACYFNNCLAVVDCENGTTESISLGQTAPATPTRRGEFLFHDATYCFQKWMSCASCHPDSRTDGLNWDMPNDGLGTPKNTKNMLFTHQTPPTTATGCRANAETSVRAGIEFFRAVLPEEDAVALDSYLNSLRPVPSPALEQGKLSLAAQRGRQLFEGTAACSKCHNGTHFTDMQRYDVGTGTGLELGMKYDVPTLLEGWRTAPYLHDGRASTLRALFTEHNPDDQHGVTSELTENELSDLIQYIYSL